MTQADVWVEALEHWGLDAQIDIAIEEMSELTKELCKYKRGQGNIDHIAEEIADVFIMLGQMEIAFTCDELVNDWIDTKTDRLAQRLNIE